MTNELDVDPSGLYAAAVSSESTAARLIGGTLGSPTSRQPSALGVSAVNAALAEVQRLQSARITGQAGNMAISAADYARTDADGAEAITTVSV